MKKILISLLMLCCMTAAWAQDDGFVNVATTIQLWDAIKDNPHAKVRLTADFALSDINKDYELYCNGNTFYGTIDGNGHTIKGDPKAPVRARTYMFYNCSGATFKNLTFKGIRVNSDKNSNQAIITATAKNGCVFENITFENVHTWTNYDNAGSAAGWAENCTFTNITVKNSDFTVDDNQAGCVVGHAIDCTFTNIKVENCESTSVADFGTGGKSGGVAGRTDDCTISNVEILGCFIKAENENVGGVVGYSASTQFTNCTVDDQSCVCVSGWTTFAYAGGIVGHGTKCNISNCINSALIAADVENVGGIIGYGKNIDIVGCLNTGMVIAIKMDEVKSSFFNKYKTKTGMTCVTKTYQGKEYVIRKYGGEPLTQNDFGGIAGDLHECNVSKCANFGSVYSGSSSTGGIAGHIKGGTINDCLSDFSGCKDTHGICQFESVTTTTTNNGSDALNPKYEKNEVSIKNCLNMTTYKDFKPKGPSWEGFTGSNNYSLTTATDANLTKYITKTTAADLESSKVCHLLGKNWEQNLGTDAYPTPTGDRGIYHMREVYKKEYGTICVPFPLETLKGVGVGKREYYLFDEVKNEADGTISICFKYTDVVPAGTPAIFRAYVYSDYYFMPMEKEYQFEVQPTVGTEWTFNGTFEQKVFDGDAAKSIYYLDGTVDKSAIKNAKKTTVAPYRAYFHGPNIDTLKGSAAANIRIIIEDEDGETTAISLVNENYNENENFGGKTYSLMGTEVNDSYRGIVIKNGKKYINR